MCKGRSGVGRVSCQPGGTALVWLVTHCSKHQHRHAAAAAVGASAACACVWANDQTTTCMTPSATAGIGRTCRGSMHQALGQLKCCCTTSRATSGQAEAGGAPPPPSML